MAVFQSGPFNIEQGGSANFTVEFFDINGFLSVPSSASMTVTYINTSANTQTDSIALVSNNRFFTGTWSSTSSSLGLATWVATAPSSAIQQTTGQIRVIQRQGG